MGSIVSVPAYLVDLGKEGPQQAAIVRRVVSAVTRTAWQTGHLLDISSNQAEIGLTCAAHWGNVASLPIRCGNCNTIATLAEWEAACNESREHRRSVLIKAWTHLPRWKVAHLTRCSTKLISESEKSRSDNGRG